MPFFHIDMAQVVEIISSVRKNITILLRQYHGCWSPGDAKSQDISNHDIDYVEPD